MDEDIRKALDEWGNKLRLMILEQNKGFAQLQEMLVKQGERMAVFAERQARVFAVLDGEPEKDQVGLRDRMKAAEKVIDEWERYKTIMKGMAIGMGLTLVTSVANLITLLTQITGGGLKP